jgi:hypothetical protein
MINTKKVKLHKKMMEEMYEKHKTAYLFMLGNLISDGVDIETAIHICYNKLIAGGKNG